MSPSNGRYVILTHDHPFLHHDLMFEQTDSLRTWRLHTPPDDPAGGVAEELPPHRLLYLDYEGPVSGNRGTVTQWDTGVYEVVKDDPDVLQCVLQGCRLQGKITLKRSQLCETWHFCYSG